tara:strand:+ start:3324 stop:3572 length:249 start_codon:yes stop_codon:yes gene_type:complete
MKISESQLKQIIKEELEGPQVTELLKKLLSAMNNLDVSIDYLAASITGQDAMSLGQMQKSLGRYYSPPNARQNIKETKDNDE